MARRRGRAAPPPSADPIAPPVGIGATLADAPPQAVAMVAGAKLLRVDPGLYRLVVAPLRAAPTRVRGMDLPVVVVTVPSTGSDDPVELIDAPAGGSWIGAAGGAVVLRSPARGGDVLLTAYTLPGQILAPLDIELHPVTDRHPDPAMALVPAAVRTSLRARIILHIEREGDREFPAEGWAGRLGARRRIEAMAVCPLEAISQREIQYKTYSIGGRETGWVTDGRLCGTRGQGKPLTGFAVRLAPHLHDGFNVAYRGAFFSSGPVAPVYDGAPCLAPLRDDPLEAVEIRILNRDR